MKCFWHTFTGWQFVNYQLFTCTKYHKIFIVEASAREILHPVIAEVQSVREGVGWGPARPEKSRESGLNEVDKETAEMAVKGVCMLLCFLAACFSAGSTYMLFEEDYTNSSNFTHRISYPEVHTPRTWICLTTSGGKMLMN